MTTPHAPARDEGAAVPEPTAELAPSIAVDADLMDLASALPPGWALDLGCGAGQNAIWLARRGWRVLGVDISPDAVEAAKEAARAAGAGVVFGVEDITSWAPGGTFDLVLSTFALPPRGSGRGRAIEMAVASVAPGGTILISDLDISLGASGTIAERHLASVDELTRHVDGFRIGRADVRMSRHLVGHEERILPVVTVVATRRTDLRRL